MEESRKETGEIPEGKMLVATTDTGLKMEVGRDQHYDHFLCWISDQQYHVIGFGKQKTINESIKQAMTEAQEKASKDELCALLAAWSLR